MKTSPSAAAASADTPQPIAENADREAKPLRSTADARRESEPARSTVDARRGSEPLRSTADARREAKPLPCTRPARADAARNYDLLVTAAREAFAVNGTDTSLEEIARRAGVGIGTLYRRFPSRTALLEAVYVDEIQSVCDRAYGFADELGPFDALAAWLRSFVGYNISKKSLAGELTVALGKDSEFFTACKVNVREAGDLLLNRAKEAGTVRPELELTDILRLVGGITMGREMEPDQAHRLLDIVLAGLRPVPAA